MSRRRFIVGFGGGRMASVLRLQRKRRAPPPPSPAPVVRTSYRLTLAGDPLLLGTDQLVLVI